MMLAKKEREKVSKKGKGRGWQEGKRVAGKE